MSKTLENNEIEDILSSVRRLVSPEARPRPVSRDLGMEKLLLTPSHRVVPEQRVEPLVLSVRATDPENEPPLADVVEAPMHVVEGEWEDAFWSEPETALAERALEVEEAELVPAVEGAALQDLDPTPYAQDDADWRQVGPGAEPEPDLVVPFPQPSKAAPPSSHGVDTLAGLTDADGNPVTVFDEEALNEIVRTLIREELQGALGERITQNVRKLVRAEINRALTARSLD